MVRILSSHLSGLFGSHYLEVYTCIFRADITRSLISNKMAIGVDQLAFKTVQTFIDVILNLQRHFLPGKEFIFIIHVRLRQL